MRSTADSFLGAIGVAHNLLKFNDGPSPGDLVPDARGVKDSNGNVNRLYAWLTNDMRHQLLVFPGPAEDETTLASLYADILALNGRWSNLVRVRIVTAAGNGDELSTMRLVDTEGELARRLGASHTQCALLLRPDGYVGYRSEPALLGKVEAFLRRTLEEKPS